MASNTKDVSKWLDQILPSFNLANWEITVATEPADSDSWADIEAHSQANTATLRIAHGFWALGKHKQRLVLTHEVCHILTWRLDECVEKLEKPLGELAWAVFAPNYDDYAERTVEQVATVIAPFLPLP